MVLDVRFSELRTRESVVHPEDTGDSKARIFTFYPRVNEPSKVNPSEDADDRFTGTRSRASRITIALL